MRLTELGGSRRRTCRLESHDFFFFAAAGFFFFAGGFFFVVDAFFFVGAFFVVVDAFFFVVGSFFFAAGAAPDFLPATPFTRS